MAWCIAMAFMAAGAAVRLCDYVGLGFIAAPVATFVLFTAVYFFAYGVEAHDKEASIKRAKERASIIGYKGPGFPKDPFAP